MSILSNVNSPQDLQHLTILEMEQLAFEVREYMVQVVRRTGGHLAASLGVVELTLALMKVFPELDNRIIWDVGHQSYAHKILTGRRDQFASLRQQGGLAGFPRLAESPYDAFDTGHSSTSISLGLGMALAKRHCAQPGRVVAVIGDGALTAGLAFEGLNQAGDLDEDLIVVLNDNGMSIAPNVGALSRFMSRATSGRIYQSFRQDLGRALKALPAIGRDLLEFARRTEESIKAITTPGILFEAFKFNYVGPIDGHDLSRLLETFHNLAHVPGPILVHVLTQKGRGFLPAEENPSQFHGISAGHVIVDYGEKTKQSQPAGQPASQVPSYTQVFGQSLLELAKRDKKVIAISAAMSEGTGLMEIGRQLPQQFIDVGIAEQHAVTMAAGLASQGLKPVVAIYSTFMQRAYDQVVHDVCIPNVPVVLALDRAGLVGEDGSTHQGTFDISYLRPIPNLSLLAPADENELKHMLFSALKHNGPVALRYPRGRGLGVPIDDEFCLLPWGKGVLERRGKDILLLPVGNRVQPAREAADMLKAKGIKAALINPRFIKPLDEELICRWAEKCGRVLTVEENMLAGGFGSLVLETLNRNQVQAKVALLGIDDRFVEHATQDEQRDQQGLHAQAIALKAEELL